MKDRKVFCLNNISPVGLAKLREGITLVDSIDEAAGVLVRSADMKEMQFPPELRAIARAGAGRCGRRRCMGQRSHGGSEYR